MLLNLLHSSGSDLMFNIALLVLYVICILLALICHEVAHGLVANWLGDPTAKQEGRLTFNPLAHIDPVGFLMMLFVGYGWAKPVPVNPRRLRKPRRDMAIVSFAGPLANLLLALFAGLGCCALVAFGKFPMDMLAFEQVTPASAVSYLLLVFMRLNIGLAVFNLIPIPPMDGSNILVSFLRPNAAAKYLQLRLYTQYIFLGIIALNVLSDFSAVAATVNTILWTPFYYLTSWIGTGILSLGCWIFGTPSPGIVTSILAGYFFG